MGLGSAWPGWFQFGAGLLSSHDLDFAALDAVD
jgi:hypothetical protein